MNATSTDLPDLHTVKVFRDHPEWNECRNWFGMRSDLLTSLYVATYEFRSWTRPYEGHEQVLAVEALHPGCVYVY